MKTITKLAAMLLAAAALAAMPAMAQDAKSTNAAPKAPKAMQMPRGVIDSVDATAMILTLKTRGTNTPAKIKITSSTKITKGTEKEPAQFSDAVAGMRVTGSGKKGDDGIWSANTLNITSATPKPAAAKPATPAAPQ